MTDQAMNLLRLGLPPESVAVLDGNTPAAVQTSVLAQLAGKSVSADVLHVVV